MVWEVFAWVGSFKRTTRILQNNDGQMCTIAVECRWKDSQLSQDPRFLSLADWLSGSYWQSDWKWSWIDRNYRESRIWISRGFPWVCLDWKELYNTIELGREWDVALGRLVSQSRFLKSGGGSPTARKVISRNIIKRNFETMVLGDYWVDFDRFGCSGKLKCISPGFWHYTSFIVAICWVD